MRVLLAMAVVGWFPLVAGQTVAPPPASTPTPAAATPPAGGAARPSTGSEPAQPTMGDDKDTIAAAQKWLALLDDGKVGVAWDVSSKHLKSVVTRQEWVKGIADARKPFGKLKSRTPEKFARSHAMPGAPDGDYSIIEFVSEFANGKRAQEQLIWMLEPGDVWRVSGYYIR
ncbi:MAG TPA: DUF4019 domain-containing protein [Casimicrobiaceae bacterium]|nr:DUF4019 domain-containing protein [Casimicrobiaceae bacterium]